MDLEEATKRTVLPWKRFLNIGKNGMEFVYFDEKTLERQGIPLAFCALLLYNNANLLEGGLGSGRTDRNRIR